MPIISRTDFFRVVAGIEGVHVGTQLLEAFRHVDIEAVLRLIFLPKEERQANIYHIQYDHLFYLILFIIRPERAKVLLEKYTFL